MITAEYIRKYLEYNVETGKFFWKEKISPLSRAKIGYEAGCKTQDGYRIIRIKKKNYSSHRLAWLYVFGKWPLNILDHINGIKDDNRISNLREATTLENSYNQKIPKNNTSGYKGVYYHKKRNHWRANCGVNGKRYYFSGFKTAEEANDFIIKFRKENHGEFVNHG